MACSLVGGDAPANSPSANTCPPGISTYKMAHAHKIIDRQVTLLIQIPGIWLINDPQTGDKILTVFLTGINMPGLPLRFNYF
jgi:hypothetical protein